jgi:hypothetical protein
MSFRRSSLSRIVQHRCLSSGGTCNNVLTVLVSHGESWSGLLEFGAFFGVKYSPMEQVKFDPYNLAVLYYFGDLSYWQLPAISADALEHGFDGRFLRRLAGLVKSCRQRYSARRD